MTAAVIPLASAQRINAAWDAYCALVIEQRENDRLRTDLEHNQRIARAWEQWRRLYLQTEHAG